jgi:hypothetical protein
MRQLIEISQAGQSEFIGAVHDAFAGNRDLLPNSGGSAMVAVPASKGWLKSTMRIEAVAGA